MAPELTVQCHPMWLWKFNTLLQKGVQVKCLVNRPLMEMLKEDFDLEDDYINQRIQTLTLNGRPVDDPTCAMVPDEATLAISGAMPGLAGATLRKGGFYAAMRGTISYCARDSPTPEATPKLITVKLFNLILKDLATDFLSRGIGVAGIDLAPLLDEGLDVPAERISSVSLSGEIVNWAAVRKRYLEMALIFVVVKPTALSTSHGWKHTKPVTRS